MIDVVFLLIVFFLTTAQFARMTRADIDLPLERGEQAQNPDEAGLIINLTKEGTIIIADQEHTFEEMNAIVRDEVRNAPASGADRVRVLVRADRDAGAGMLNRIITSLRDMGVGLVRLGTEVPR